MAALDVGIVAPAAHSSEDAAAEMFDRKVSEREPIRPILEQQNIWYQPIVWTAYGRPHAQASKAVAGIARKVARRRGSKAEAVLAQMQIAIGVCIARRAARMSLACYPRTAAAVRGAEVAAAVGIHFVHEPGDLS